METSSLHSSIDSFELLFAGDVGAEGAEVFGKVRIAAINGDLLTKENPGAPVQGFSSLCRDIKLPECLK